jgi:hypothetical protein
MNDEMIEIWREVVIAYFQVVAPHSPRGAEKTHEKFKSELTPRVESVTSIILFTIVAGSIRKSTEKSTVVT